MLTTVDDVSLRVFFCVFNLVWVTLFLEAWKRNSASLAYTWGTINTHKFEEARPAYYGELGEFKVGATPFTYVHVGIQTCVLEWNRHI